MHAKSDTNQIALELLTSQPAPCVGRVVSLTPSGQAVVDFPGNPGEPVVARSIVTWQNDDGSLPLAMPAVLIVFEMSDWRRPIVVGIVRDEFLTNVPPTATALSNQPEVTRATPAKKVIIEAHDKLELRCGKSSIELARDGKLLINGTQIVSRATQSNRIKGSSVAIN